MMNLPFLARYIPRQAIPAVESRRARSGRAIGASFLRVAIFLLVVTSVALPFGRTGEPAEQFVKQLRGAGYFDTA
ncbi:MAG: hypothetical protein AAGJ83_09965, partial [Planctomycetota bacterium]